MRRARRPQPGRDVPGPLHYAGRNPQATRPMGMSIMPSWGTGMAPMRPMAPNPFHSSTLPRGYRSRRYRDPDEGYGSGGDNARRIRRAHDQEQLLKTMGRHGFGSRYMGYGGGVRMPTVPYAGLGGRGTVSFQPIRHFAFGRPTRFPARPHMPWRQTGGYRPRLYGLRGYLNSPYGGYGNYMNIPGRPQAPLYPYGDDDSELLPEEAGCYEDEDNFEDEFDDEPYDDPYYEEGLDDDTDVNDPYESMYDSEYYPVRAGYRNSQYGNF